MKKHLYLLPFIVAIALCSCETNDPWGDDPVKGTFLCPPELPATISSSNYTYVTHTAALKGKTVRNYSMCFDKTKYAAQWVAYPLHQCYTLSGTRTDAWAYDPDISSAYQVPTKGYSAWGYTRGHQIPSADRLATTELNAQTFYMSNMTPQPYDFNTNIWAELESKVRSQYMCLDTLYVVTGAYWKNTDTKVGKYPVPTHYYKVFLRTRKGNSGKTVFDAPADELKCIGFWMDSSIDGNLPLSSVYCKSVADIEKLTGFTFFPKVNVDKTQCVASDWGFSN